MNISKFYSGVLVGDMWTNKFICPNATCSTQEIHDFIPDGLDSGDLDVVEVAKHCTSDGLMVIRHFFGFAFIGERLISQATSRTSSLIPNGSSLSSFIPEERQFKVSKLQITLICCFHQWILSSKE